MHSLTIASCGATIRYHDIPGSGRPLIFVHGLGCSSSSDYPSIAADERLKNRRRILIDLLGSGFSDKPVGFSYRVEAHADVLLDVLLELKLSRVDLVGHSMGGSIAITAAGKRPDLVSGLILSEPNLDSGGGFFSRRIAEQTEEMYVGAGHSQMIREAKDSGNEIWAGTMAVSSPIAVYRAARSLIQGTEPSWRNQLERFSIPRTVLFGELSLPDSDMERLRIHGVHVAIVPKAGHSMIWENPSGVAGAIAEAMS